MGKIQNRRILITGGTIFVSKFIAEYFKKNNAVYVLNRNTHRQVEGVTLIEADRRNLNDVLKGYEFDTVIDVCAYTGEDVRTLLNGIGSVKDYILISSSAVYPETNKQPFNEEQSVGANSIWGAYGSNKIEAEQALLERRPDAYILRPPYLYGPMNNIYREAFVFDCALKNREFYVPKDGSMKLQFFHVEDLCRMIESILSVHPDYHIYNVGNPDMVDINTYVKLCYQAVGKPLNIVNVFDHDNQRDYFSFNDYGYELDVSRQRELLMNTKDLAEGLRESYEWYKEHKDEVNRKNYIEFIDLNLRKE